METFLAIGISPTLGEMGSKQRSRERHMAGERAGLPRRKGEKLGWLPRGGDIQLGF